MSTETMLVPDANTEPIEALDTAALQGTVDSLLSKEVKQLRTILASETQEDLQELAQRITETLLEDQVDLVERAFPNLEDQRLGVEEVVRGRLAYFQLHPEERLQELELLATEALEKEKRLAIKTPEEKTVLNKATDVAKSYLKANAKMLGLTVAGVAIVAGLIAVGWWTGVIPAAISWLMKLEFVSGAVEAIQSAIGPAAEAAGEAAAEAAEVATEAVETASETFGDMGAGAAENIPEITDNVPVPPGTEEAIGDAFKQLGNQ